MTISIWRYSHLALAVSSFILLTLASVTGVILAFKPIQEKINPYRSDQFEALYLSDVIPQLRSQYPGITKLSIDANQFVQMKGTDQEGENMLVFVDPKTGNLLGKPEAPSEFFEWVTALHRSLFLHETGRFFIGLTSFLLLLITISGTVLIIQRQRGVRRFLTRIVRENFAQYYHVVLGRLSLIPIFLLALTGTYLSLARFELIDTAYILPDVDYDAIQDGPPRDATSFDIFKNTPLSEIQSVDFPFSEDVEDYYTLQLKDRALHVNQVTGEILSEVKYPVSVVLTEWSVDLHTGRTNAFWAILLALASGNILFFIYSGFAITLKRRSGRIKNNFTAEESNFIILTGSENGSTFRFAQEIYKQLLQQGKKVYACELNDFQEFPKATHIIVMTATYGLGNPPTNAAQFAIKLAARPQVRQIHYSVVGFGSHAYPDFCKFAFEVDNLLSRQDWATPLVEIHTINDKSPQEFGQWASVWAQHAGVTLDLSTDLGQDQHTCPHNFTVTEKTVLTVPLDAFRLRLRPEGPYSYASGDLLAIYPGNDHRERLYSIGKVAGEIQLSIKLHPGGLGSEYLYGLQVGDRIHGRIDANPHFHFPEKARQVVMVSNGTGIAPFLGMIDEEAGDRERYLYCGFRDQASFSLYESSIREHLNTGNLASFRLARSREGSRQYVKDLLAQDQELIVEVLKNNGVIMLCGSLAMQQDVVELLDGLCTTILGKTVSYYQSHGQILMDCY
ncbi:PepSY domain-containing protein [Dyadobacter tibetensis]|uniref:PepSY domain-containing protein n=1 Tax=Dyadobacter tibetensis TaxID=1211851 RepID=UPI000471076D|nr:PepSY domain-containing protein [Dyadobacter tibetensis]